MIDRYKDIVTKPSFKYCHLLSVLLSCLLAFLFYTGQLNAQVSGKRYIGAEKCKACHQKEYANWKISGHAQIIHKAFDEEIKNIPIPAGYSRKTISYVIGGYKWKTLFLGKKGYLITSTSAGPGNNQYDIQSRKWIDYLPGKKIPYDCGRCHTTGNSQKGHQDNLEGISGTWKFASVQCEACHGPGSKHADTSLKTDITIERNNCSNCHSTKPLNIIPLKGVFIAEYTETNQLLKSKMNNLACIDCHNPHLSSEKSIKQTCNACHQNIAGIYKESYMYKVGVKCTDCHMPPAGIIAEGDPKSFKGDFKSHLFKIIHNKPFPVVTVDRQRINPGYLSVDYSCMRCHNVFENREWAVSFSMFSHRIKITTDVKIMRLQRVAAYIGFLFALTSLLSGLYLKNLLLTSLKMNKKTILSIHRLCGWITFSLYIFISVLCIYFHFPLAHPSRILNTGWFLIHPANGVIGLFLYAGKILNIRKYKKGWASQGLLWGIGIFLFWVIQLGTVIFHV
jgi:hypothetical protein